MIQLVYYHVIIVITMQYLVLYNLSMHSLSLYMPREIQVFLYILYILYIIHDVLYSNV